MAGDHTSIGARTEAEARRLEALEQHGILDTPPEDLYDSAAEVAARLCDAPIGIVSFVDAGREWVKASYGAALGQVNRAHSLGDRVVNSGGPLAISDLGAEADLNDHPWVAAGPRARFYVAVPLYSPGGLAVGTLAVLDTRPRDDEVAGLFDALAAAARTV